MQTVRSIFRILPYSVVHGIEDRMPQGPQGAMLLRAIASKPIEAKSHCGAKKQAWFMSRIHRVTRNAKDEYPISNKE